MQIPLVVECEFPGWWNTNTLVGGMRISRIECESLGWWNANPLAGWWNAEPLGDGMLILRKLAEKIVFF